MPPPFRPTPLATLVNASLRVGLEFQVISPVRTHVHSVLVWIRARRLSEMSG